MPTAWPFSARYRHKEKRLPYPRSARMCCRYCPENRRPGSCPAVRSSHRAIPAFATCRPDATACTASRSDCSNASASWRRRGLCCRGRSRWGPVNNLGCGNAESWCSRCFNSNSDDVVRRIRGRPVSLPFACCGNTQRAAAPCILLRFCGMRWREFRGVMRNKPPGMPWDIFVGKNV